MNKSADTPIIYDFFSKSLKDAVFSRRNQASDHNFKGIPAEIVGVSDYESMQCVDVRASINDVYVEKDNLTLESITLKRVFVSLPNTGGFKWKQPVKVGDKVRLSWAHRDLGDYLDGDGSSVDININEIAQIEDCWVTLDGGTRKNHTNPSLENLIIEGPNTEIVITPDGEVTVKTSGTSYIKSSHHTVDTDMTITGNLLVKGNETVNQNVTIGGNTSITGTTTSTGLLTATSGVLAGNYGGITGTCVMVGSVTIGGVSVGTHTHIDSTGNSTGGMQ